MVVIFLLDLVHINAFVSDNYYSNDVYELSKLLIGPNVSLFTAEHPIAVELINEGYEYVFPIKICDNVWIGEGTIVNPGGTIEKNSIIVSGIIVTKDIPDNVITVGNPFKVIREITNEDKKRYFK